MRVCAFNLDEKLRHQAPLDKSHLSQYLSRINRVTMVIILVTISLIIVAMLISIINNIERPGTKNPTSNI